MSRCDEHRYFNMGYAYPACEWKARAEKAEVQLAGCGRAALGYGEGCMHGDYGWSASLGDVMQLRADRDRLREMLREVLKIRGDNSLNNT